MSEDIRRLQARVGVIPDGVFGPVTIAAINAALDRTKATPAAPSATKIEPRWVAIGRTLIGLREIPGPRHSPIIVSFWRHARWLRSDEDAWCGGFIMHCLDKAGLPFPRAYPSAASWASYGVPCQPQVGAIGVKARTGGNHVFLIVGETRDGKSYKALGGNQNNTVSIVDIPKGVVRACRWPPRVAQLMMPLPKMASGIVATRED